MWRGGDHEWTPGKIAEYGAWRGADVDFITVYSGKKTWEEMKNSEWSITMTGQAGVTRLNYGLVLLPAEAEGQFTQVSDGSHDDVFRTIGTQLQRAGHGDAWVRLGWEANLRNPNGTPAWAWSADASTAEEFKAAWNHAAEVLLSVAPDLKLEFGINCGSGLRGDADRLAALTRLYPGPRAAIIGCDTYNWWNTSTDGGGDSWAKFLRPADGPGIADVADFARSHGALMGIGEWGNATPKGDRPAPGDNAGFVKAMYDWAAQNSDALAAMCWFDEPDDEMRASLIKGQMPQSATMYRQAIAQAKLLDAPTAAAPAAPRPEPLTTPQPTAPEEWVWDEGVEQWGLWRWAGRQWERVGVRTGSPEKTPASTSEVLATDNP